jgi:hypothetical protein
MNSLPWSALLLSMALPFRASVHAGETDWKEVLRERIPLYGHRNYICIVDSAYPVQSREGVETLVTDADQLSVVKYVLGELKQAPHVRPVVLLDHELDFVPEADAPGIEAYRTALKPLVGKFPTEHRPHEDIIHELDKASALVRVLILKTRLTIPYTSVFLRLECGYWSAEAEQRLRAKIKN